MTTWQNRIIGEGDEAPDQLLANPNNWRIHPTRQQDALAAVLDKVGWVQRVVVNQRTGFVIDGHLRVALAISKGEASVPVLYVDLDEQEEALVLATLDTTSHMAVPDTEQLGDLLESLRGDAEIEELLLDIAGEWDIELGADEPPADPGAEIDRADELQAKWQTARGQVWRVGRHRVMCGDSTSEADVARLMDGKKPDAIVTDPPYGVGIDYASTDDSAKHISEIVRRFMVIALTYGCPMAITSGHRLLFDYPRPNWIGAWIHQAATGLGPWGFTSFNPILYYGKDPYLAKGLGSRSDALVMNADRQGENIHPVSKPVEVWKWFVERVSTSTGDTVLDFFLGSGTTLVACEQLERIGYGMEIDPAYVAVTLERLAGMGLEPRRMEHSRTVYKKWRVSRSGS